MEVKLFAADNIGGSQQGIVRIELPRRLLAFRLLERSAGTLFNL